MNSRIKKLSAEFEKLFGKEAPCGDNLRFFAAPGRVNLIGEHIDYCGGYVFPAALTLDNVVAIRRNGTEATVRLAATDLEGIYSFELCDIEKARGLKWGNYQAGVAKELIEAGCVLKGVDMLFDGTIPFGSGLSSSASIELAAGVALSALFGGNFSNIDLALMGQRAENNFCDVNCGIMDQFASGMGKKNHAVMLNCGTLEYKYVPLDLGDNVLILANTCKKHALGSSKYNERRKEVEIGLRLMQQAQRDSGDAESEIKKQLCDYTPEDFAKYAENGICDPVIKNRVQHVIFENDRVKKAVSVLEAGDLEAFGNLMREANQSIRYLYEATGDELDAMYDAAQGFDGCVGSRMCGGGFGGCTVNIVNSAKVDDFIKTVGEKYTAATGITPQFYVCEIGDGARELFPGN